MRIGRVNRGWVALLAVLAVTPEIWAQCQPIGLTNPRQGLPFASEVYRANVFRVTTASDLTEIQFEMAFSGTAAVSFSVHEKLVGTTEYVPLFIQDPPVQIIGDTTSCMTPPCAKFYSTGTLAVPVSLKAGRDYAIGVTWNTTQVQVFRSLNVQFPQPFSDGDVLGSTGAFVPGGPPLDSQQSRFLTVFNGAAWTMKICLAPKPGACCDPVVGCIEVTQGVCDSLGGDFSKPLFTCSDLIGMGLGCPLVQGACCVGLSCSTLDKFSCQAQSGLWQQGVSCGVNTCLPTGACCMPDASCSELTRQDCATAGGVYQGDVTTCLGVEPACGLGACCTSGICLDVSQSACANTLGVWGGNGTMCMAGSCEPTGACCQGTTCSNTTASGCTALSGTYQGDWSTCDALPVSCGRGACCTADLGCVDDVRQSSCENAAIFNGTFQGIDTTCDTLPAQCAGTCCRSGSCIDTLSPGECTDLPGGAFVGYGNDCTTSPCALVNPANGACCLPNGNCVLAQDTASQTASVVCGSLQGTYRGDGSVCTAQTCTAVPPPATGACCFNGMCAEVSAATCAGSLVNGTYQGDGTTCSLELCAVGSCCLGDGTCDDTIDGTSCGASLGASFFTGTDCTTSPCPPTGACCLPNGICGSRTENACLAEGGIFAGDGTMCGAGSQCTIGSCCLNNGSCADTIAALCPAAFGSFDTSTTCSGAACPAGGACCKQDDTCQTLTASACATAGGVFGGDNTLCADVMCTRGACCQDDGTCTDNTVSITCEGPIGGIFNAGSACMDNVCALGGACCDVAQGTCQILTQAACSAAGGGFEGDTTTCFPVNPCTAGACCLDDGSCFDLQRSVCASLSGQFSKGKSCLDIPAVCPSAGACCTPDDTCQLLTQAACEAGPNNVFEGLSSCQQDPFLCLGGSCCLIDGSCTDNVLLSQCDAVSGLFNRGFSCASSFCQPRGACCKNGSCTVDTQGGCNFNGGVYQGDQSSCVAGLCQAGACCSLDGSCSDGKVSSQCAGPTDIFSAALMCANVSCVPRGACCRDNAGTCDDGVPATQCQGSGESWAGPGSLCEPDLCTAGACCLVVPVGDPENCQPLLTLLACRMQNGFYQGANSSCVTGICDTGACCSVSGVCTDDVVLSQCDDSIGFRAGGFCFEQICEGRGACCHGGTCTIEDASVCTGAALQGIYSGDGTTCSPADLCVAGPCCLPGGTCGDETRLTCERQGGFYEGPGGSCVANNPNCQRGSCCSFDGTCVDNVVTLQCLGSNDVFTPGASCASVTCDPHGACCNGGSCSQQTQAICLASGGFYEGDGMSCTSGLCTLGACCFDDGTCADLAASPCGAQGGTLGVGLDCVLDAPCPAAGACCLANGTCQLLTQAVCIADPANIYEGDGVACSAVDCSRGSCCSLSGTCSDTVVSRCAAPDDTFFPGPDCAAVTCRVRGACCQAATGSCTLETSADCATKGGTYQGDGVSCTPDPCALISIVSAVPPDNAIDARQPHPRTDSTMPQGWDFIVLTFDGDATSLTKADFAVVESGGDGIAPNLLSVVPVPSDPNSVTLTLDAPIEPTSWTTFTHNASGTKRCLGFLPGDVNASRGTNAQDITALINSLNGVIVQPDYAADINRSGPPPNAQDITSLINLLNGAGQFIMWNGATLPNPSPCD